MTDYNNTSETLKDLVTQSPSSFFTQVKNSVNVLDRLQLQSFLATSNKLLEKARETGQKNLAHRLEFKLQSIKAEMVLNQLGYNRYIYRDDVINYMDTVEHRVVKLAEVKDYLREIPEEAIKIIKETEGYFDDYLILYTDYTDELGKQVEQEKKDRDPILFGIFYDELFREVTERFYFLYDWVDEYCDLTLDKMIEEYKELTDEDILHYANLNLKTERKQLKQLAREFDL